MQTTCSYTSRHESRQNRSLGRESRLYGGHLGPTPHVHVLGRTRHVYHSKRQGGRGDAWIDPIQALSDVAKGIGGRPRRVDGSTFSEHLVVVRNRVCPTLILAQGTLRPSALAACSAHFQ